MCLPFRYFIWTMFGHSCHKRYHNALPYTTKTTILCGSSLVISCFHWIIFGHFSHGSLSKSFWKILQSVVIFVIFLCPSYHFDIKQVPKWVPKRCLNLKRCLRCLTFRHLITHSTFLRFSRHFLPYF